jgi:pantetheine-phosphate adenylyltransferase
MDPAGERMSIAAVPGSYDPVTAGHVDIIRRAAALFDHVYAVAMVNVDKAYLFTPAERLDLLRDAVADLPNVTAEFEPGYFYAYARARGVTAIVKGVRSAADFTYELEIAAFNRAHYPGADTLLLPADPALCHISSAWVKEQAASGRDISAFVTEKCSKALKNKLL